MTKKVVEERFSARQKVARQHEDVVVRPLSPTSHSAVPMSPLADITAQDTWIRNGVAPEECEREINLLIPAGAETTTTVIRATFLFILSTPAVYRKLKDEITEGVREGRVSSPITNEEAKKLPYLQVSSIALLFYTLAAAHSRLVAGSDQRRYPHDAASSPRVPEASSPTR